MSLRLLVAIAIGGALGSLARHLVATQVYHWTGAGFPWGTVAVNVAGSFVMGALAGAMALLWSPSAELRAFLTVGFLGGFTTFSAFSMDAMLLIERGRADLAFAYMAGSVVVAVGALFAGLRLVRVFAG